MATLCHSDPGVYMARVSRLSHIEITDNEGGTLISLMRPWVKMPLYPSTAHSSPTTIRLLPFTSWGLAGRLAVIPS